MALLPKIKIKTVVSFPAAVYGGTGIAVVSQNGNFYFNLDYSGLYQISTATPNEPTTFFAVWQQALNTYARISYADLKTEFSSGGGFISEAPLDGSTYGRKNAAWVPAVNRAGDTMTGTLTLTGIGSVFANIGKSNLFGTAGGTAATGAVTTADANIVLYNFSPTNWAGIGVDNNGNIWFKTGITGNPVPAFYLDNAQVAHFLNPMLSPTVAPGDNSAKTANTNFVTSAIATSAATLQPLDSDLTALAANVGVGSWTVTGVGSGVCRVLMGPAAGVTVTNGNGVAGNPTLGLANDLAAVEGLATTGIVRRTVNSPETWTAGGGVTNAELAAMNAFTFLGNNTAGAASPTSVDISTLATKATPTAADYVMLSDQAASGAWKKASFPLGGGGGGRVTLAAATTYYVRTDGNDANTGLVNSAGGAFLTIQHAVDIIATLDLSVYQVTVQLGAPGLPATFTGGTTLRNYLGLLAPIIVGDTTTPGNYLITVAGDPFFSDNVRPWHIRGCRLKVAGAGGHCLHALNGGIIYFQNIDFNGAPAGYSHLSAGSQGVVKATGTYTISGGGDFHLLCSQANVDVTQAGTIVVSGTPAFPSGFAYAANIGFIYTSGATFSGAATGPRHSAIYNAVIYTGTANANYFPGSVAGSPAPGVTGSTGGQFA